eukprot:1107948-Alexandrium_andersonii.AAC.1
MTPQQLLRTGWAQSLGAVVHQPGSAEGGSNQGSQVQGGTCKSQCGWRTIDVFVLSASLSDR